MYKNLILFVLIAVSSFMSSCDKHEIDSGEEIRFSVAVYGSETLETKADLVNDEAALKSTNVFVDCYDASTLLFSNERINYMNNGWKASTFHEWPSGHDLTFYAKANSPSSPDIAVVTSSAAGQKLAYFSVPSKAEKQLDIMLGYYMGDGGMDNTAHLNLYHPLTSVVFRIGDISGFSSESDKIESITINGIYSSGECTATYASDGTPSFAWNVEGSTLESVSDMSVEGLAVSEDGNIGTPFVVIPQSFGTDEISINLCLVINGARHEYRGVLPASNWQPGKTNVYKIDLDGQRYDGLSVVPWNPVGDDLEMGESNFLTFDAETRHVLYICKPNYSKIPESVLTDYWARVDLNLRSFYYSKDGIEWHEYDLFSNSGIEFGGDSGPVYIRGNNNIDELCDSDIAPGSLRMLFRIDYDKIDSGQDVECDVRVSGNILSVINKDFHPEDMPPLCLATLFARCYQLKDASGLIFPTECASYGCYYRMFVGCTSLKYAPQLPTEVLADRCYSEMFARCTSLKNAPSISANIMAPYCCAAMFGECESLETAPELPATSLADWCYDEMFTGCYRLKTAPELPATSLAKGCYSSMFYDCVSLEAAPELHADVMEPECYYGMFAGCSSIQNAPALPAKVLAKGCYKGMFDSCTSLREAPDLQAEVMEPECYSNMFDGCSSIQKAPELPAKVLAEACYSGIFSNCTSLTEVPELPANVLSDRCYEYMFSGCESLEDVPELPIRTLAAGCYSYMFSGCKSLKNTPVLDAVVMESSCYEGMFSGCVSLENAPELPAKTLAQSCYKRMFNGCNSLKTVPVLDAAVMAASCYDGMFSNCTSITDAPELPAETLAYNCYSSMFTGCTSLNQAPPLRASTFVNGCYDYMFMGCSKISEVYIYAYNPQAVRLPIYNIVSGAATTGTIHISVGLKNYIYYPSDIPDGWQLKNDLYEFGSDS